jgi:eukaryotic-like serine/threonine-protein kinase
MSSMPPAQIGPYRVESPLGEGGMGVVYRAFDTKLNRPAAIKFLSGEVADPEARRRFQREAQMVSSLNHPHILTVYDAGEVDGRQYLITEFVDGGTLKDWAKTERRTWLQVIELLVGVADGLAAAHAAGILHRDIKPANILVAKNGYAKLSDFGLAKLMEGSDQGPTGSFADGPTRPGIILGTIAYMSPEQCAGKVVDARSDIFSFGVVLYELLAGRKPFEGASGLDMMRNILERTPEPLPASIPPALRIAVEKALEKDPADRYQSMRDLVVDLRRVARQSSHITASMPAATKRSWLWAGATVILLAIAVGMVFWRIDSSRSTAAHPVQYEQLTHFADSAVSPALSPDGRMLTFIRGSGTFGSRGEIYVQHLPSGEPIQLTHDGPAAFPKMSPVFLPDGLHIAYSIQGGHHSWDTWIVSAQGGGARAMLENASGMTWTDPAGQRRIMFSEYRGIGGVHMGIVTSTESRSEERDVYVPISTDGMAHRSYLSPDGKQVLLAEMEVGNWLPCRLTPYDGSSLGKPVGPSPARCHDAAWSPDGKWMYFSAELGAGFHIWRQRFPDGAPEQVTFGATEEEGVGFAPDGRSFVTSIGSSQSTVWVHDSRGERQISSEGYGYHPSFSADGKKLYYLVRSEHSRRNISGNLYVVDLESGKRDQLLPNFLVQAYDISDDGQHIVFVGDDDNGRTPVWLASLDSRSGPRTLSSINARTAYFTANDDVIFLGEEQPGVTFLYRVKQDGSGLQKIARSHYLYGVSPDGKWVSSWEEGATDETRNSVVIRPVGGGSAIQMCGKCAGAGAPYAPPIVTWSRDQKYLFMHAAGGTYALPIPPGETVPHLPPTGLNDAADLAALPAARSDAPPGAFTGTDPTVYAFTRITTQRNIYRVPVP